MSETQQHYGQDERRRAAAPRTYSRRAVLRAALAAATASAGGAVLAACGGAAAVPTSGAAQPTATATGAAAGAARATTTTAVATTGTTARVTTTTTAAGAAGTARATATAAPAGSPVAADGKVPAPLPGVPEAYLKLPPPFKSVNAVPGKGSKVTVFHIQHSPPIPGREQNRYWQELEKRLGVTLDINPAPVPTLREKFAALIASGDLPDLVYFDVAWADAVRLTQQGGMADLTPYLTGAALREYPNLAAIPEGIWKNLAINKKLYGVPKTRYLAGNPLSFRQDWGEKVGITAPKNGEEFLKLVTDFTRGDPDGNGRPDTYGLCAGGSEAFGIRFFQQLFRVPHGWRLNGDNTLTNAIETDEYRQAVAYARRVHEAGVFHPDTGTKPCNDLFVAGQLGGMPTTITGLPGTNDDAQKVNPAARVTGLVPFGFDGGKAVAYNNAGFFGEMGISARAGRDRERVRELLGVLNYYAAPFGSEENIFLSNGLEGVHHTVQPDGTRVLTDLGKSEIGYQSSFVNGPFVFFRPNNPPYALLQQEVATKLMEIGIDNPVQSLYSPTNTTRGPEFEQLGVDRITAIVAGREPLSALDTYIRDWRSRGGDQIRKEYEEALRA
jgi:putative aldouronate transport system substrate-binding protein